MPALPEVAGYWGIKAVIDRCDLRGNMGGGERRKLHGVSEIG